MHTLPLVLSASLLAVGASASAQSLPYPHPDTAPVSTVQVPAPVKSVWLRDDQARQVAGTYLMSNGWSLKVRPASRYIDAAIDSEKPMRLLAVSPDRFVSRDGNVTMEFNQGDAGDEMTMSYVPGRNLAQLVVITSRMAQR
ncbi:MAG TPA: hypothetical protein VGD30_09425 [Telluria sp.]